MRDRRGFGKTVSLDDQVAGPFFEFLEELVGKRGPAANDRIFAAAKSFASQ